MTPHEASHLYAQLPVDATDRWIWAGRARGNRPD